MEFVSISTALNLGASKKRLPNSVNIYALFDVSDGGVRYVGRTRMSLANRLAWHIQSPTNWSMREWLQSRPGAVRIVLLEIVAKTEMDSAERGWIEWFRRRGRLLNVDPGGYCRTATGKMREFTATGYQEPVHAVSRPSPGGNGLARKQPRLSQPSRLRSPGEFVAPLRGPQPTVFIRNAKTGRVLPVSLVLGDNAK